MRLLAVIFSLLIIAACSKTISSNAASVVKENCSANVLNTFLLCQEASSSLKTGQVSKKYWIEDMKGNIVFEGVLENGNVGWLNDDAIELVRIPGNIATEQTIDDYTNVYVISEKKTMTKKAYLSSIE